MRYTTILFDLDGTVIDSADAIIASYGETLRRYGLPPKTPEEIRRLIGPLVRDVLEQQFGLTKEQSDEAGAFYHQYFAQVSESTLKLYPGIRELLGELNAAGARIVSASLRTVSESAFIVEQQGLSPYFTAVSGHDAAKGITTKEGIIRHAMELVEEDDPARVVMIGDTDKDAIGAIEVGVNFIAAEYGFGFLKEEEPACYYPVCTAKGVEDIRRFLMG